MLPIFGTDERLAGHQDLSHLVEKQLFILDVMGPITFNAKPQEYATATIRMNVLLNIKILILTPPTKQY